MTHLLNMEDDVALVRIKASLEDRVDLQHQVAEMKKIVEWARAVASNWPRVFAPMQLVVRRDTDELFTTGLAAAISEMKRALRDYDGRDDDPRSS